jgi:8-amino-3,8-dideoxy-alpha-D-manno-octulosonate transaminase
MYIWLIGGRIVEKLAIYGGRPVREKPFPSKLLGSALIGDEELAELKDVIAEKSPYRYYGYGNPRKVRDFEQKTREMLGSKYTLAVSSGSAALYCACAALGLGPGDEVIIPAFGWFSNYYAVIHVGALPVFADIDDSLGLDPDDFERKITPRTKAVMVVHYQGGPARMDRISAIARAHGIAIIEDCCQAFGGSFQDKLLGTWGDIGLTSFNCVKMLTAGEGGLLWTDNEEYFVRAVRYHDIGRVRSVSKSSLRMRVWQMKRRILQGFNSE